MDANNTSSDKTSSDEEGKRILAGSGRWGDICADSPIDQSLVDGESAFKPIQLDEDDPLFNFRPQYVPNVKPEITATHTEIFPHTSEEAENPEMQDVYGAPAILIKKTFRTPEPILRERIIAAFTELGVDIKITGLYITRNEAKDHAYMILNSAKASEFLFDGTINLVIPMEDEDDKVLWFDKADHLMPSEDQDEFTLYMWQLPKDKSSIEVCEELKRVISAWCPILKIEVPHDSDHKCLGWAKVHFKYMFDTQKCLYMLNYNLFMDCEVRAGFCNSDKTYVRQNSGDKSRKNNPRKTPPKKSTMTGVGNNKEGGKKKYHNKKYDNTSDKRNNDKKYDNEKKYNDDKKYDNDDKRSDSKPYNSNGEHGNREYKPKPRSYERNTPEDETAVKQYPKKSQSRSVEADSITNKPTQSAVQSASKPKSDQWQVVRRENKRPIIPKGNPSTVEDKSK